MPNHLPPGPLAAYLGVRDANANAGLTEVQKAVGVQGLLSKINEERQMNRARNILGQDLLPDKKMMALMSVNPKLALGFGQDLKVLEDYKREQAYRNELSALGPNPDQTTLVGIASKYAGPKDVLAQHQRSIDAQERLDTLRAIASMRQGNIDRPKLKPGERFTQEGNIESIPGSDIYVKQSGLHAKDYAAKNIVDTKIDSAIDKIDEILESKGFEANFGGYNAYAAQYIPGDASNTRKIIESLKDDLKSAGLELMRQGGSIGQMTEREWPIVEGMIAKIDPVLGEKAARQELQKVRIYLSKIKANARDAYDTEWSNTQFYKNKNASEIKTPGIKPERRVLRTGTHRGRKVTQYTDGSIEYAD